SVDGAVPMPAAEDWPVRPVSPYGVSKLAAESLCDLYGRTGDLPWVALRYFTAYGPGQRPDMAFTRWLKAARDGAPLLIYGRGDQIRDFTYVDDVVEATVRAAFAPVRSLPVKAGDSKNDCGLTAGMQRDNITSRRQLLQSANQQQYGPLAQG
ncbi:MAG: UDP-glucose 4-epimerase, partial [Firmicutes bacterium]|nr:UDP-glucose 4-epimerase [Bacillota bacterium]